MHFYDAQLYRLKGQAILMRDSSVTAPAEECFRKAIASLEASPRSRGSCEPRRVSRKCSRSRANATRRGLSLNVRRPSR
jgi:hypothetical protein